MKIKPTLDITRRIECDGFIWDVVGVDCRDRKLTLVRYDEIGEFYVLKQKIADIDKDVMYNIFE